MSLTSKFVNYTFRKSDKKRDIGLSTPREIERVNNLSYGPFGVDNLLDLYYPKDQIGKLPVILNIHGGGWVYGTKETYQYYCMSLAKRGFLVVNFNYRLAPAHKFPAQLEDVHQVLTWLHQDNKYPIDLEHVFFVGDSAGAHLASLYASFCINQEYQDLFEFTPVKSFLPKAMLLNCGIYDLKIALAEDKMLRTLILDLLGKNPTDIDLRRVNPIEWISLNYPPTFIMSANADFLLHQAPILRDILREKKIPSEYKIYGTDDERLFHDFQCNIKTDMALKCNEEQIVFLKSFIQDETK